MTDIADVARITRLGLALDLREAAVAPVLAAVTASKSADVVVGANAHGGRFDIVMPFHPDALAAVSKVAVTPPPEAKLRLRVDGDRVSAAITTPGAIEPSAAVAELSPESFREAWLDLVEQFCAVAGGRIIARTRFVDEPRGAIEIRYGARPRAADLELAMAIDQLAGDIDVSAAQRRLWMRIHPDLGLGREIAVTTGMAPSGISSHLGITYPITDWSLAVRVARGLTLDDGEAAKIPQKLGELAGVLDSDRLTSLELVLGPNEPPDLLLWTKL